MFVSLGDVPLLIVADIDRTENFSSIEQHQLRPFLRSLARIHRAKVTLIEIITYHYLDLPKQIIFGLELESSVRKKKENLL